MKLSDETKVKLEVIAISVVLGVLVIVALFSTTKKAGDPVTLPAVDVTTVTPRSTTVTNVGPCKFYTIDTHGYKEHVVLCPDSVNASSHGH